MPLVKFLSCKAGLQLHVHVIIFITVMQQEMTTCLETFYYMYDDNNQM